MIANALADVKPVPALPDTESLVRDLESRSGEIRGLAGGDDDMQASALRVMSVTAHLRSLADAIHDCRDKTNAIDWEAWNRNYF